MLKFKKLIFTSLLYATTLIFIIGIYNSIVFAHNGDKNESSDWNVRIINGTKDLNNEYAEEVLFEVQDNPNVVKGKMAPGSVAIANIEVDLSQNKYVVDFDMNADLSKLPNCFKLTAKIDGSEYTLGENKTFEAEAGVKSITLTLTWENGDNDTLVGFNIDQIRIPVMINVAQHV